jgi:regulatory protein YycI of two-component signal transduction system YycFG
VNLGRAKLILIIAFAGLNLFLAYHLFWPDFGRLTRVAISAEDLNNLENMLEDNNYRLQTTLDRSVRTANFLTVSTSLKFQRSLILQMLQDGAEFSYTEDGTFYRKKDRTVMIQSTGLIKVLFTPPQILGQSSGEVEQNNLNYAAEQFLINQSLKPEGLTYNYTEENESGEQVVNYYQVIDELPVYAGSLKVYVTAGSVQAVEIYWLDHVEGSPTREMEVITAMEAIKNLIRDLGPAPEERIITEVKLGHFSMEYNAEKWEIPPVWRIVLQNGQIYYINAFTGNFELKNVIPEQLN